MGLDSTIEKPILYKDFNEMRLGILKNGIISNIPTYI